MRMALVAAIDQHRPHILLEERDPFLRLGRVETSHEE